MISQWALIPETPDCPLASIICKKALKKSGYVNYTISHILKGSTGKNCLRQLTKTGRTLSHRHCKRNKEKKYSLSAFIIVVLFISN